MVGFYFFFMPSVILFSLEVNLDSFRAHLCSDVGCSMIHSMFPQSLYPNYSVARSFLQCFLRNVMRFY